MDKKKKIFNKAAMTVIKIYNFIIRIIAVFLIFPKLRRGFREIFTISVNKSKGIQCKIGKFTYYGHGTFVGNNETVIGKYTSIADNVAIGPGEHPLDKLSTSPYFYVLPGLKKIEKPRTYCPACEIGNDVWVGENAFIRAGVKIGDGAVIGACSCVLHDVPPYAVFGGVPARIIKYRFSKEIIEKLVKLKWWNLPDSIVAELPFDDVNAAIEKIEELRNGKYPLPETVIARTSCLGNFTMQRLNLDKFQVIPFHKNRVDYCMDISKNPDCVVDRNDALKYIIPDLHVFLNPQVNDIFACDNVKLIIMDSFTDLTDKMFVRKKDGRCFTMLYQNIDHSSDFDSRYKCTGMIQEKDIPNLYSKFFDKLIKTYGDIPVIFLEFSSNFDQREEFIRREQIIHDAIMKVAKKHPCVHPIQMDVVEPHETDDYPYHYSEHTYDMLAKKLSYKFGFKLK